MAKDTKVLVIYDRKNVLTINAGDQKLRLVPGANRVDSKAWEACRGVPRVKKLIEDGIVAEESGATVESLDGMKPAEAKKLIKNTIDLEVLEIWKLNEKRADVVKAIEAQIDALTKEPTKEEGEE